MCGLSPRVRLVAACTAPAQPEQARVAWVGTMLLSSRLTRRARCLCIETVAKRHVVWLRKIAVQLACSLLLCSLQH